jgi:hypothetical protein
MSEFTHHNTCINLVDIAIESDDSNVTNKFVIDPFNLLNRAMVELDDNIHIAPRKMPSKRNNLAVNLGIPNIQHPRHIQVVPVLLDDRRHLAGLE